MALTPLAIKAALPKANPYRLADGGSLFVVVHPSGSKSFEFRYRRGGKVVAMLNSIPRSDPMKMRGKARNRA